MAYFKTNVLDNQIKALPTVDTASGAVANFTTDKVEDLLECVCDIQYSQVSSENPPSPTNPLALTYYNTLNLSHSGADTSNPTVITIPLGNNVGVGTLDVLNGILDITHLGVTVNGTEQIDDYLYSGKNGVWVHDVLPTTETRVPYISNMSVYSIPTLYQNGAIWCGAGSKHLFWIGILDVLGMSLADFKTWLTSHNLQVVYQLSTPQRILLSANQITALLNENNIWCDTNGDTEVKYLLTVGKAIS